MELSTLSVCVVATSKLIRTMVGQSFLKLGITPIQIDKPSEIINCVRTKHPHLLIIQYGMESHGTERAEISEVIQKLRHHNETSTVYIVALSTSQEAEAASKKAGADSFIAFPFEVEQLSNLLEASISRRKKVLLVDDSRVIHQMIAGILTHENYELFHAYNGKQALEMIPKVSPDLVITDIEMPEMSGYEVCSWVKNHKDYSRLPVIISSTLSQSFEIDKGFDAGADDYMVKPVDADEMINKLRGFLYNEMKKQREHLLVVDDSKVMLSIVVNALENQGFRVSTATKGDEGLKLAQSLSPALVITDFEMPGMNGRELTRKLRQQDAFKLLPIVMLTGRDEQVEKTKARAAGVSEFVTKPFTADKMLALVERLLAEARVRREREAMISYMSDAAVKQAAERAKSGSTQMMTSYRDHAAVLFSDVCGFTEMSEKRTPEEIINLLNSYFDDMVTIIKSNGGIVDKFIGDAIMAVFYGKSPADNAYGAAKAALEMIDKLKAINSQKQEQEESVHIRIGVHSGELIFGDLGSKAFRRDFTVIGDTVNTAQRLESNAPKDHVLVSDATLLLIKDKVLVERSETLKLKGKKVSIQCHVLKSLAVAPAPQGGA